MKLVKNLYDLGLKYLIPKNYSMIEENNILGIYDNNTLITKSENFVAGIEINGVSYISLDDSKLSALFKARQNAINSVDDNVNMKILIKRRKKTFNKNYHINNNHAKRLIDLWEGSEEICENSYIILVETRTKVATTGALESFKRSVTTSQDENSEVNVTYLTKLNILQNTIARIAESLSEYGVKVMSAKRILNIYAEYCNGFYINVNPHIGLLSDSYIASNVEFFKDYFTQEWNGKKKFCRYISIKAYDTENISSLMLNNLLYLEKELNVNFYIEKISKMKALSKIAEKIKLATDIAKPILEQMKQEIQSDRETMQYFTFNVLVMEDSKQALDASSNDISIIFTNQGLINTYESINQMPVFLSFFPNKFDKKDEANQILESIKDNKAALIADKQLGKSSSAPAKPFTTSKLLKVASKKLKLSTDAIQKLAQELFEKGLITYIRTDSEFISLDFLKEMQKFYSPIYKDIYEYREYKAGKNSQAEAHEAIRITHCHKMEEIDSIISKEKLSDSHKELYTLIFLNTLCSQLKNAQYETAKIIFNIRVEEFILNIKSLKEKGYKALFDDEKDENNESAENEQELQVDLSKFAPNSTIPVNEIFLKEITKNPPKLYLESDFIEVLEKSGIGRPSTYATYIPVLLKREYITINKKRQIEPTKLGIGVIDFLKNHKYKFVLDLNFTKELEEKLDLIKDGQFKYLSLMKEVHNKLDFIAFNKNENGSSGSGGNVNPPSESQMKFCNSIATQLNIKLPEGIDKDWRIASKFINDNKNKLDKTKKGK